MRKININHLLAIMVVVLLAICVASIYNPMHFNQERESRENDVKRCLMEIRKAEQAWCKSHGTYQPSLDSLVASGLLERSSAMIPHAGGKPFRVRVSVMEGSSGGQIPLMECGAQYDEYLSGMDRNLVATLMEQAAEAGQYPGLKIGDIEKPNDNAGNWE